ncbi:MAG: TonB-dependent receptor, partial [Moraxellaceae bacterium]
REAKHLASLESNFSYGAWNWNLLTYHQSERFTLGANGSINRLDDFWVFNSKLRYKFKQGYSLSMQAKNVTDLNYSTPSQGVKLPQGVPNRGRELSLVLDIAF